MVRKVRYGVFRVQQSWKLYTVGEASRSFEDRAQAVAAGASAAREAMALGCDVQLHLQDSNGEVRQADMISLAH